MKIKPASIAIAMLSLSIGLPASAALLTTTNKSVFDTQIGLLGYTAQVTGFDGPTPPIAIANGGSYDGIQFNVNTSHALDTLTGFQISNGSTTTSAGNRVGGVYQSFQTAGSFYSGDIIDLVFGEVSAFGLYIISSGTPQDAQVSLTISGSTASLSNANREILVSPTYAFFMGIYDNAGATFTSARLASTDGLGGSGAFNFYVDDIVRATGEAPVPGTLLLMLSAVLGLAVVRRPSVR